jgi:hypothetical protein
MGKPAVSGAHAGLDVDDIFDLSFFVYYVRTQSRTIWKGACRFVHRWIHDVRMTFELQCSVLVTDRQINPLKGRLIGLIPITMYYTRRRCRSFKKPVGLTGASQREVFVRPSPFTLWQQKSSIYNCSRTSPNITLHDVNVSTFDAMLIPLIVALTPRLISRACPSQMTPFGCETKLGRDGSIKISEPR